MGSFQRRGENTITDIPYSGFSLRILALFFFISVADHTVYIFMCINLRMYAFQEMRIYTYI